MTTPGEKRFDDILLEIVDPYEFEETDEDGFTDAQIHLMLNTPGAYINDVMPNVGRARSPQQSVVAAAPRVMPDDVEGDRTLDDVEDDDVVDDGADMLDDGDDVDDVDDMEDDVEDGACRRLRAAGTVDLQSDMPKDLKDYWLRGEGAVKIRWGTEGSFRRCVREMKDYVEYSPEGLCANLYHEATGHWPGEKRRK